MVRLATLALSVVLAAQVLAIPPSQVVLQQSEPIHTLEGWSYTDCGDDTYIVDIESLQVVPDPPQRGKDLTIRVTGTVKEQIEEGAMADVTVKLGLIKLLHKQFDLCEEARTNNIPLSCPVAADSHTVEHTVTLPKDLFGKFTIQVRGYTAEDKPMVCLDFKVDFMKRPFFRLGWGLS